MSLKLIDANIYYGDNNNISNYFANYSFVSNFDINGIKNMPLNMLIYLFLPTFCDRESSITPDTVVVIFVIELLIMLSLICKIFKTIFPRVI